MPKGLKIKNPAHSFGSLHGTSIRVRNQIPDSGRPFDGETRFQVVEYDHISGEPLPEGRVQMISETFVDGEKRTGIYEMSRFTLYCFALSILKCATYDCFVEDTEGES